MTKFRKPFICLGIMAGLVVAGFIPHQVNVEPATTVPVKNTTRTVENPITQTNAIITAEKRYFPENKTKIHLYISPHPDDELEGFATLSKDPSVYTVMLVGTRGEQTYHCNIGQDARIKPQLGEIVPPYPAKGKGTLACMRNRMISWNKAIDEAGKWMPAANLGENKEMYAVPFKNSYIFLEVGDNGARATLNQPETRVQSDEYEKAVIAVLDQRGHYLPNLPLWRITSSAYWATPQLAGHNALPYPHPDHKAVRDVGFNLAHLASDGAWIVTYPFDKQATDILGIPDDEYQKMMQLKIDGHDFDWHKPFEGVDLTVKSNPLPELKYHYGQHGETIPIGGKGWWTGKSVFDNSLRVGIQQRYYGWIADPVWIPGVYALYGSNSIFAQKQFFIHWRG